MDIIDQASNREIIDRELALAALRAARSTGPSASHCQNCGAPIPETRQRIVPGVVFCVECQAMHERRGKVHA